MEKLIKNFENYTINENGEVFSIKRNKYLKIGFNRTGYRVVTITNKMKKKHCLIHRLIAEAFIPNPNNLPQVNHINGIKKDNRIENLEWVTCKENIQHAYRTGLIQITDNHRKNCRKLGVASRRKINQYDLNGKFIKTWESITSASKFLGVSDTHIGECCMGRKNKSNGYIWRYADDK